MSVTECRYSRDSPPSSSLDERGRATHTISYRVTTDEDMAPPEVANNCQDVTGSDNEAGAVGGADAIVVPELWDSYSYQGWSDPTSFLREIDAQPISFKDNTYHWQIDTTYRPLGPGETPQHANKDGNGDPILPENRPARVWIENEVYSEVLEKDRDGKPFINTAGQPYDDVIEEPAARSVLVVMKSVPDIATVSLYTNRYQNSVNNAAINTAIGTYAAEQLYCRSVTSSQILTEGTNTYYDMTFRFSIHEVKWVRSVLERGYMHFDFKSFSEGPTKLIRARNELFDDNGDPFTPKQYQDTPEPVLLTNNGFRLVEGEAEFTDYFTTRLVNYSQAPFV